MSLLPPNSSDLEAALDTTCSVRIEGVDVPIEHLWDPDNCPESLLPWLAWAVSVDEWNPSWSETQKRNTIKASPIVHRHKGTRYAVDTALVALGYDVSAIEWWEKSPKGTPGTYSLNLQMQPDQVFTENVFSDVERVAGAAKNTRSHLENFTVSRKMECTLKVGTVSLIKVSGTIMPYVADITVEDTVLGIGTVNVINVRGIIYEHE